MSMRERFWAVLGHGGCSAGGSYCCCSRSSSKQAQVSGISEVRRLTPTLGSVPCGVGMLCGDSIAHVPSAQWWGTALACDPWEQPRSLSPVQSAPQEPSSKGKTFNFGHTETLRALGGQEWQEPSGRGRAWDSQDCCAHTPNAVQLDLSSVS